MKIELFDLIKYKKICLSLSDIEKAEFLSVLNLNISLQEMAFKNRLNSETGDVIKEIIKQKNNSNILISTLKYIQEEYSKLFSQELNNLVLCHLKNINNFLIINTNKEVKIDKLTNEFEKQVFILSEKSSVYYKKTLDYYKKECKIVFKKDDENMNNNKNKKNNNNNNNNNNNSNNNIFNMMQRNMEMSNNSFNMMQEAT